MNELFKIISRKLNNWENHRTQTEYDDALIIKTVVFQFVNSYILLFYIAFIKSGGSDGKGTGVSNIPGQGQEERKVQQIQTVIRAGLL